jgi:hypothetical protein
MVAPWWLGGLTLLALAFLFGVERVVSGLPPPSGWAVLTVTASGCAFSFVVTGSLALGQLAGALVAGTGVALVLSLPTHGRLTPSGVTAAAAVLTGLLLSGYFYSELPAPSALLLVASPLAPLAVPRSVTRDRAGWVAALVHGAATAVPVAVALLVALRSAPPLGAYY